MTNYQKLLQDPRWFAKRQIIIERDDFRCTKCGFEHELQVHHEKYFRGLMPWEYDDKYLTTLCASYHSRINDGPSNNNGRAITAREVISETLERIKNRMVK